MIITMWYLHNNMYDYTYESTGASLAAQWVKNACNEADWGSIPVSVRPPGEGNGNPIQYPCLENPMDREVWQATVHGVTRVEHDFATKPPP